MVWTPAPLPEVPGCEVPVQGIAFASPTRGFAVGPCAGLYLTTDGGESWTRDGRTGLYATFHDVAASGEAAIAVGVNALSMPTVLLANPEGIVWRSFYISDASPIDVGHEGSLTGVVRDGDRILASATVWNGKGAIVRSLDGGRTWWTSQWVPERLRDIAEEGPRAIAVGDKGLIVVSDDAGASWSPRASGVTTGLRAVAVHGGIAIAVGEAGIALRSTDGGDTWLPSATGTSFDLHDVATRAGEAVAVGAAGTVRRSTDGGLTWLPEPALTVGDLRSVTLAPHGAFAGATDEILRRAASLA